MPALDPIIAFHDYVILITNGSFTVLGDPLMCWISIDVTLRFNEPDSAEFVAPAYDWILDQLGDDGAGRHITIIRDDQILIAGPLEDMLVERADNGENAGVGRVTVKMADDSANVMAREVYPTPAAAPAAQAGAAWTFTGNAETGMRTLVNLNAGPGALVARRVPQLTLGPVASVGTTVTVTAQRMQMIGDVLRRIAEAGGTAGVELGFRVVRVGNAIQFRVFAPVDRSGTVRFGFDLGNMTYISYQSSAPTATAVTVGGQGETGAEAAMIERTDAAGVAAWGRMEKHIPRAGNSTAQVLQDEGDKALGEGAATTRLATAVRDTVDQQFGRDYTVGDIAAVDTLTGAQVAGVIRTVHLQVYATSGEYVSATVGSQAAVTDQAWVRRMRELEDRLGTLERTITANPV